MSARAVRLTPGAHGDRGRRAIHPARLNGAGKGFGASQIGTLIMMKSRLLKLVLVPIAAVVAVTSMPACGAAAPIDTPLAFQGQPILPVVGRHLLHPRGTVA